MQTEVFLAAADAFLCLFQIVGDCFLLRHHEVRKRSLSSSPVHHSLLKSEDKVSEMDISHVLLVHRASIYVFFSVLVYVILCHYIRVYEDKLFCASEQQTGRLCCTVTDRVPTKGEPIQSGQTT